MARRRKTTLIDLLRQAQQRRALDHAPDAARWTPGTGWINPNSGLYADDATINGHYWIPRNNRKGPAS